MVEQPKFTISRKLVEDQIENYFDEEYDIIEDYKKTDFEIVYEHKYGSRTYKLTIPFTFEHDIITCLNEWISAHLGKNIVEFRIKRMNQNPKAKTLQEKIDLIMEYKKRKQYERENDSMDIKLTEHWLNQNMR